MPPQLVAVVPLLARIKPINQYMDVRMIGMKLIRYGVEILIIFFLFPPLTWANTLDQCEKSDQYNIGVGIHDITGPAAEQGMMGYGMLNQRTAGIWQRLWARAFIIESPCNGKKVVFVNADLGQLFQAVKQEVVKKIREKYGAQYDHENILLTATHTHSGPGGYSTYALYNLTTLGFDRRYFDTIVQGIVAAIAQAHEQLHPGKIAIAMGELTGITYNRSPTAYALNPLIEQVHYHQNIDTDMTLIRLMDAKEQPVGLINWFPIHGVSFNNKNHFINGDNKGYAAYLFEQNMQTIYPHRLFVAAFAQANAGDVSPNPLGQSGGEGLLGRKAVEKAGLAQYQAAKHLFDAANETLKGDVDYRHTFVTMDELSVSPEFTHAKAERTCPAAIGLSMLAGTQDGEGIGWQGIACNDLVKIPFLRLMCQLVTTSCQGVKPIAISTGTMKPYPWTPRILPLQMLKIGQLIIVAVPFELTTMTGRRIKEIVAKTYPAPHYHIVLSTLANAYAGYVATHEEYQLQRYEGASTHFGPWTEAALQQEFAKLSASLASHKAVPAGMTPPDLLDHQVNLQTGVLGDDKPLGNEFGEIHEDVKPFYHPGEIATVVFWGAHPRNDYYPAGSFLAIEKLMTDGTWKVIKEDNDWETGYAWARYGLTYSLVTITWYIPQDASSGKYRIVHHGTWKHLITHSMHPYQGVSSVFNVG